MSASPSGVPFGRSLGGKPIGCRTGELSGLDSSADENDFHGESELGKTLLPLEFGGD